MKSLIHYFPQKALHPFVGAGEEEAKSRLSRVVGRHRPKKAQRFVLAPEPVLVSVAVAEPEDVIRPLYAPTVYQSTLPDDARAADE